MSNAAALTADVKNIDAVPFLKEDGKKAYKEWTFSQFNRAFAINPRTGEYGTSGTERRGQFVEETALESCPGGKAQCFIYAIDDRVVWDGVMPQSVVESPKASANEAEKPSPAQNKVEENPAPIPTPLQNSADTVAASPAPSPTDVTIPIARISKPLNMVLTTAAGLIVLAGLALSILGEKAFRTVAIENIDKKRDRNVRFIGYGVLTLGVLLAGYALIDFAIRFASWVGNCAINDDAWTEATYIGMWIKILIFVAIVAPALIAYFYFYVTILFARQTEDDGSGKAKVVGGFALFGAITAKEDRVVQSTAGWALFGWFLHTMWPYILATIFFMLPFYFAQMFGNKMFC